jgi:prepilin-type N-terminal cleavage/methylation domain-containing protein
MMPTSPNRPSASRRRTAGYSLLETMIALAIMSLAVAVMMPRAAAALDQVVVHTVQFDLQRQVAALKRRAVMTNTRLVVGGAPAKPLPVDEDGPIPPEEKPAEFTLRAGWTYQLSAPLVFDTDAHCSPVQIELLNNGQKIVHLVGRSDGVLVRTVA